MQQRPSRVLITVVQHYMDSAGGSPRFAYDEALYLQSLGHEVWVLAPTLKDDAPEYEVHDGLHLLRYHHQKIRSLDPRRAFWHKRAVVKLMKRYAPPSFDIIHGHSALQYIAACDFLGSKARTCFSVHSPIADEFRANARGRGFGQRVRQLVAVPWVVRIERECLRRSNWVNAFSDFTVKMMEGHHGDLARSIHVTRGWTDLDRFHVVQDREAGKVRLGWRTDVPVLFTLRRLVPRMGLDRLIQAAGTLSRSGLDFEVVIGGSGTSRASLERLAMQERVSDKVKFEGFVPDDELPLMYGACDAFVLPTAELECFGIIAVEALASGRPVLATPVAAIPEIMNRIEPRWMAKSASAEDIAELLAAFIAGRLPAHGSNELRGLAKRHWDSRQALADFCGGVLGYKGAGTVCTDDAECAAGVSDQRHE